MQDMDKRFPRVASCFIVAWTLLLSGCQRRAVTPKDGNADATTELKGGGASRPAAFEATGGIDPELVAAWKQAGLRFGWHVHLYGTFTGKTPFSVDFLAKRREKEPALPAFSAKGVSIKGLQDLPVPEVPFALHLQGVPLTEGDVKALARFPQLQSLALIDCGLRDTSLKDLGALQQLQDLVLNANRITDAGLKELAGLTNLKLLSLGANDDIRGPGLKDLAGLPKLETLSMFGIRTPNAVCKELAQFKQLRVLDLNLSKVNDEGLKELAQLEGLELLNVAATQVTDAGLAEIRKALPKCLVQR
jgi:hypothetical protein